MKDDRIPYRWQDRVAVIEHTPVDRVVTAVAVLVVGAAVLFAAVGAAHPAPLPAGHAEHVATERTEPLAQLAKRPVHPGPAGD